MMFSVSSDHQDAAVAADPHPPPAWAVTTDEHAPPPFLPQVFTIEAASSFLSLIFHSTTRSKQTISSLLYVDEEK